MGKKAKDACKKKKLGELKHLAGSAKLAKGKGKGELSLWNAAKIACKHGVGAKDKDDCMSDVCTMGDVKYAGDTYVAEFLEMAYAGHLPMHVGRGKCLNGKGQPYTDVFAKKKFSKGKSKNCADFLAAKAKGQVAVLGAQWDSKKKTCTVYQLTSKNSWAFVKSVQKKTKRYDCFKVVSS